MLPEGRHLARATAVLATLLALTAVADASAAHEPRGVGLSVALDVVETTSWTAHGSYAWCGAAAQRLPYDGSGRATLHLSLPADAHGAAVPAAPISLATTLSGTVERSGSYVEHDAAVGSPPSGCPAIDPADSAADTSGCGRMSATLAVTVDASGMLRSQPERTRPSGCPWLTDVHGDTSQATPAAILEQVETYDGLAPLALGTVRAPSAPAFNPTMVTRKATQTWHLAIPGGRLDLTTTTQVRVRIALLPLVQPGASIAGIRLGETLAELRRTSSRSGRLSIGDDGDLADSDHRWEWHVSAGVPYLDLHGNRLYEDVWVSAPAGNARSTPAHRIVVTHAPPPPGARVTYVGSVSTLEVTKEGLGEGSTLADLRRGQPRGHLLVFGQPIAWLVDGPGRRRTAFMLFRGVVQTVEIGCHQTNPRERGAPVDYAALC